MSYVARQPKRTHRRGQRGAAVLTVLVLTAIAFSILCAAFMTQYGLQAHNRRLLKSLQQRADALVLTSPPPSAGPNGSGPGGR